MNNKSFRFLALWGMALVFSACSWPSSNRNVVNPTSPLSVQVQVQNPTDAFDSVGDTITFTYIVTNTGSQSLARPFEVTDTLTTVDCPGVRTVGNQDTNLDPGESLTCTGTYALTQADLDARSVTNTVTASAAGGSVVSSPGGVTVPLMQATPGKTLGLTKTANPTTYSQAGQTITFSYEIRNTGSLAIGPAQFAITDNRISGPFPCGANGTTLNPGQTVTCTANYTVTQQDMGVNAVTNSATASGGDAQPSSPASATITNTLFQNITPSITPAPSNLTRGSTISHTVEKGEWMLQIARCYGVSYESLRGANRQISNPSFIEPGQVLTVPNIGSAGTIYGRPCVVFHTVAAGDTWNSIATRYNARVDVLQEANPAGLVTGATIKVPINSAGAGAAQVPVTGATITNTPITPTTTATPTFTPTLTATVTTPVVTVNSITPTATSTSTTPIPGGGAQNRVTFPPGVTTVPVSNVLIGHETVSYLLAGAQGQTLSVSLAAPINEIALRIQDPSGINIKPLDGNMIWTGTLPATGDYRIDLVGLTDPNKSYILTVTLTGP